MFASTIPRVRFEVEHALGCGDVWNKFTYDVTGRGDSATYSARHKELRSDLPYTAEGPTSCDLCYVTFGKDRMGVPFGMSGNQVVFRTNAATLKGITFGISCTITKRAFVFARTTWPAFRPVVFAKLGKTIVTSCNAGRRECQDLRAQVHPKGFLGL